MSTTTGPAAQGGKHTQTDFAEEARVYLAAHPGTCNVEVMFSDINGIAKRMQFPVSVLDDLAGEGLNMPASTLVLDSRDAVYPDRLGTGFLGDPDAWFSRLRKLCRPFPGPKRRPLRC